MCNVFFSLVEWMCNVYTLSFACMSIVNQLLFWILLILFLRFEILYCSMGCIKFSRSIFSSQRNLLMYDNEWVSLLCTAKQARWVDANRRSWWKGHKLEWPPCSWCSCHFTIYRFVSQILSLHDIIMINQWIIHFL
jgi:hypothetical protein